MRNKYRQQNSKERRREKGKDEREGMRGYLQTLPPSLTAVPNGKTLLVPLASLRFMSLFYFLCVFSVFFFLFLFSARRKSYRRTRFWLVIKGRGPLPVMVSFIFLFACDNFVLFRYCLVRRPLCIVLLFSSDP